MAVIIHLRILHYYLSKFSSNTATDFAIRSSELDDLWKIKLTEIKARAVQGQVVESAKATPVFEKQSEALLQSHKGDALLPAHVFAVQVGLEARQYCVIEDLREFYSWYS